MASTRGLVTVFHILILIGSLGGACDAAMMLVKRGTSWPFVLFSFVAVGASLFLALSYAMFGVALFLSRRWFPPSTRLGYELENFIIAGLDPTHPYYQQAMGQTDRVEKPRDD